MVKRIALIVSYSGSSFHGFQYQSDTLPTVQHSLQLALSRIADHPVKVTCAGRTDTGVHATRQVVHFETDAIRPDNAWITGTNRYLPDGIAVTWAGSVAMDFDARFSATARRYLYLIDNSPRRSALLSGQFTHYAHHLDDSLMHEAAQLLQGEHDFTSFRASHCQARTPVRTITAIEVRRQGTVIVVDVRANAFLHHMIRNIVGTLVVVGSGHAPVEWVGEVLQLKDRDKAGVTARPQGLYLIDVVYPDRFGLPPGPDLPNLYSLLLT